MLVADIVHLAGVQHDGDMLQWRGYCVRCTRRWIYPSLIRGDIPRAGSYKVFPSGERFIGHSRENAIAIESYASDSSNV